MSRFIQLIGQQLSTLESLNFEVLTCKEHHKVKGTYDGDDVTHCAYDGFVFEQSDGTVWHNQYPRASYGQMSDKADYTVRRNAHCLEKGMSRDEVLKNFAAYQDVCQFIANIYTGIQQLKKENMFKEAESLEAFSQDIQQQLKQKFNITTVVRDHSNAILAELGEKEVFLNFDELSKQAA